MKHNLTTHCVTFTCLLSATTIWAADWDQWRGPSRDGHLGVSEPWPGTLSEDRFEQQWRVPLQPSYSGPIIVGNKVFVTETRDKSHEVVRALDRSTGQEIWKVEWPGAITVPFFANKNGSWIRSTPASDGERLYVAGMRDVLVCLDIENGNEIWRVDFADHFQSALPAFGTVCSPLIDGDAIYLQAAAAVVKLNKADGKILWRSEPDSGGLFGAGMGASAFSSPVIATLAGQRQLIAQGREDLAGYDMETGATLWSVAIPAFRGMNILTPLVIGDSVFTSSYGGGSFLFDVTIRDGKFQVDERWQNKKEGYMSSPLLIDSKIYLHLRNQRLICLDPNDGETLWTTKPQGQYCSLLANGNQILALDERGELRLIKATPEDYQEIYSRRVSDETTWAHVAVSDDQVFVRGLDSITAWKWQ
jgi:outer membrane protein assembly factor BamB